jgi:DNA repair protein RadB
VLHNIPTGCKTIDEVLEGGISNREISLIYGEAETGKTTFAMQCAVNCARHEHKTLFFDCDGTFSARRLSQIASQDFEEIAKLIILIKPKKFSEQITIIDQLTDYINRSFGLVVIDTLTSLYRTEIAEYPQKTFELNREMNRQMASLAQTAKTRKIAILTTSQVRSVFTKALISIEPLANRVLRFWSDTVIAMKPTKKPQIVKAILEKTSKETQSLTALLRIEETGIREYSTS